MMNAERLLPVAGRGVFHPFGPSYEQSVFEEIATWAIEVAELQQRHLVELPTQWSVSQNEEGAILLVPACGAPEPGFLLKKDRDQDGFFSVLVCDPEEPEGLGSFETLKEALHGVWCWLLLPARLSGLKPDLPAC